jgi:hypothetical protein
VTSATLNGKACTSAVLTVPGVGLWYAAVDTAEAEALTVGAPATLQMLGTTWQGSVLAGAVVDGRARYQIVAGRGGWGKDLKPRAYANDAGVLVAQVLADVAAEAGEVLATPPTTRLGPHFSRPRGPASFALNLLAPRAWYATPAGAVAFGSWPALPVSKLPVTRRDPATRVVELQVADSFAGLLPGTSTEYGTASDVDLEVGADGAVARLYAAAAPGRRARAWARIIDAVAPGWRWRGVFEYRIVTQEGERLNLQPVRSRADLPDLRRVPVRAGVPGVKATYVPGSPVLVAFVDGDLSRPAVVGFDAPDAPGWMPLTLDLGGPGALGVARQTDPVVAGPFAGTIVSASARVRASL